ncbi:Phospholipid ABC transporter substrate-binding protein MlaD [hydrothermal vent metagenome]|uniref:Phospholipid ABC transporter substrate-binding protein MlaD n=1 Tax=hydrothermal vent metagenome TaxID=652676 RepID=A0A3B0S954_9ZZZZ
MKDQLTETIVGLFVLILAGGFAFFASSTIGEGRQSGAIDLRANFASIGGMTSGTDVRMAGVKVGTVRDISLDTTTYEAQLTLSIREDVPVPEDSVAKITSDGLLGGVYISIEPGAEEDMLAAGDSFEYTQGAVDLMGLLGQFAGSSNDDSTKE